MKQTIRSEQSEAKQFIVVGCGRVGAELAYRLFQKGHHVTVIDRVSAAFEDLPPDFRGRTLEGDVLTQDLMHRSNIEHAFGLAAVTSSDSLNAVVGHVARVVYHVPHIVVRNYDPRWRPMVEAFGLQTVSSSSWGAQRMEEMLSLGTIRTVFSAGNGEIEIYEIAIPEGWAGRKVHELLADNHCGLVSLTRAGRAALPPMDIVLEGGDIVHVSTSREGIEALRKRLS
jgi:trk system potassium uptake protein TrkA